ncbi:hypothetical protein AB6C47_001930 [Vibrio cyclitrophicus]
MNNVLVGLLVIFGFGLAYNYARVNDEPRRLGLEKYVYLTISFYYIVIPTLYLVYFDYVRSSTNNFWIVNTFVDDLDYFYTVFIYMSAIPSILFGINVGKRVKINQGEVDAKTMELLYRVLIIIASISSLITFVYVIKVGGFYKAIIDANLYRAHGLMERPVGQFAKFQPYVVYASLLLLPSKKKVNKIFIVVSIYYLIIEASRTNFAFYFISFFLYYLNTRKKFSITYLLVPIIVGFSLAAFGNQLTNFVETGEWVNDGKVFSSIISQFSPAFSNVMNMKQFVDSFGFGFFYDATSLFPQQLFGLEKTVKTWEYLTTHYLGGFYTVGIPIDLFSYGYSQLSFIGVLGYCFGYGFLVGLGKKYILTLHRKGGGDFSIILEIVFCMYASYILLWASLDSTVFYGTSKYWLIIGLVVVVLRLKK